jgi:hypothetical protein
MPRDYLLRRPEFEDLIRIVAGKIGIDRYGAIEGALREQHRNPICTALGTRTRCAQ